MYTVPKLLICVAFSAVLAQNNNDADLDAAIASIFTTPDDEFLRGWEEVTKATSTGFGALEKCGEGSERGINMCVAYYNCDGGTNTIISSENYDGTGLIDIRFGNNKCDHPLQVCCKIGTGGIPSDVVTQTPSPPVTPGQPSVTEGPYVTPREPELPVAPPIDPNEPSYCGIRNNNGVDFKITGDKDNEAEYGEFPWMVAVLRRDYDPTKQTLAICGGSLIAPNVVLTGAHCVQRFKTNEIKVRVGEWDTQTMRERFPYQERDVSQIISHENFVSTTLYNDVALLILTEPVDRAAHIGTICLPRLGQEFNSKHCFASGWGKNTFGQLGQYQVILKKIELPNVAHAACQTALRKTRLGVNFKLHESFICAGGESGKDTCTGDGGSPLVCPDPNNPHRYIQAGIVAWGIGCGDPDVPGVYADVARFRTWIDQNLSRLGIGSAPYTQ